MKIFYTRVAKNGSILKNWLGNLAFISINSLKKDFSNYNGHTELLALWTVIFMSITGLFFLAINSDIPVIFLFLISAILIMFLGSYASIYYLHALKYHNKEKFFPKTHNFLNKSFKLRTLFRFIKIPRLSILDNIAKNFRLAP